MVCGAVVICRVSFSAPTGGGGIDSETFLCSMGVECNEGKYVHLGYLYFCGSDDIYISAVSTK